MFQTFVRVVLPRRSFARMQVRGEGKLLQTFAGNLVFFLAHQQTNRNEPILRTRGGAYSLRYSLEKFERIFS